jgi:hypothetical protein
MTAILTDQTRETLNRFARSLAGQGRSDPDGMIIGLQREHRLTRQEATAIYRQWERETLTYWQEQEE